MARDGMNKVRLRIGLSALAAALLATVAFAGTNQWTNIGPYGPAGNVRTLAVDPSASGTLYAGTDGGIFKSLDGGRSWGAVNAGLTGFSVYAIAVDPFASSTVYAGTNNGVFKSLNGGSLWFSQPSGLGRIPVESLALDPSRPGTIFAGTASAGVYKSTDGAATWNAINAGMVSPAIHTLVIDPSAPSTIYAGTSSGVFKSVNGGATWTGGLSGVIRVLAIDPVTPSILYAGTAGVFSASSVYKTEDGGATWLASNRGLADTAVLSLAVSPSLPSTAFIGTQGAGVYVTRDSGDNWTHLDGSPAIANVIAIDKASPTVFAGTNTGFFRGLNEGTTWSQENVGFSTFRVNAVLVDASSTVYVAVLRPGTTSGGVYQSINHGAIWTAESNGLPDREVRALASDEEANPTLYAGTAGGGVFRSRDRGASWMPASTGLTNAEILSLTAGPSGRAYVGTQQGVFATSDFGTNWSPGTGGLMNGEVTVLESDPADPSVAYAGTPAGLYKTVDGGQTWTPSGSGLPTGGSNGSIAVTALVIDPVNSSILYAGTALPGNTSGFGVYRSNDAGQTWSSANMGIENAAVTAMATDPTGATLYAGTESGVFRASKATMAWTAANDGLTQTVLSLGVDPTSPSTVYAGTVSDSTFQIAFAGEGGVCTTGPNTLCLNKGRFEVEVAWRAENIGTQGDGRAVALTGDTGAFWFFTSGNIELVIKVVDGRAFNGNYWVFYGAMSDVAYTITVTDIQTGTKKVYANIQGELASVADVDAFSGTDSATSGIAGRSPQGAVPMPLAPAPDSPSLAPFPCAADATTLCLNANRFRVTVSWSAAQSGQSGAGQSAPLTSDSGSFWFFSSGNLELNIKVVDGRAVNGHFWVFFGALTNVAYTVTVTDTSTGMQRIYTNPQGRLASVADTSAF